MNRGELITRLLAEVFDRMDTDWDSLRLECVALEPTLKVEMNHLKTIEMMEDALKQLEDRSNACVVRVIEESLIAIMKNYTMIMKCRLFWTLYKELP